MNFEKQYRIEELRNPFTPKNDLIQNQKKEEWWNTLK